MTVYRNRAPAPGSKRQLVLEAARKAGAIRRSACVRPTAPVAVIDLAERLGVEVRFANDMSSMEGLYVKHPKPRILVSTLRPPGRQAFTAAHELGHHVFGHDGHVLPDPGESNEDEIARRFDPKEALADAFAAHLLMPALAVSNAVRVRQIDLETCDPADIYRMAWYFGVGYESMLRHLQHTLRLLSPAKAGALRKAKPKAVKSELLGREIAEDLIPVDSHWDGARPIDAQIGDLLLLPPTARLAPGECTVEITDTSGDRVIARATASGTARFVDDGTDWSIYVRVARREYAGLARYRFLPEDEANDAEDGNN